MKPLGLNLMGYQGWLQTLPKCVTGSVICKSQKRAWFGQFCISEDDCEHKLEDWKGRIKRQRSNNSRTDEK